MRRKKIITVKVKESNRKILSVLIVVFMVAFLLRFEVVATAFNALLKTLGIDATVEQVMDTASVIASISIGALLLWAGVSFVSMPFVGVAFAVAGGSLLVWQALKIYNASSTDNKISEPL